MTDATTAQLLAGVKRDQAQNDVRKIRYTREDVSTDQLLRQAHDLIEDARAGQTDALAALADSNALLIAAVHNQQIQIADLLAARAPHGPPLEGTGPLPLERT